MEAMQQEEWEALVGRPEWRKFEQFLTDYRQRTMEEWASGTFQHEDRPERDQRTTDACVRCQVYQDLVDLKYEDIAGFYFTDADSYEEERKDGDDT